MYKIAFSLMFCLLSGGLLAQQPRLGGVRQEDDRYKTVPLKSATRSSFPGSARTLRDSFEIKAMDQGFIPGCGPYSIAHALSIRRKLHFDYKCKDEIPFEIFSASYLYNQICPDQNCDSGIYITEALDTLVSQGICPAAVFPNDRYGCDAIPMPSHRKIASRYKILRYKRVFKLEAECLKDPEYLPSEFREEIINAAIAEIDQGNPVMVTLKVSDGFADCPDSRNWIVGKDEKLEYLHAMVLVGYDDVRQEFEFLNSFGPAWCDEGFVHIGYNDFARVARYGYVLYLDGARLDCIWK